METRGWKLCICFGLLSVALAKDASQSVPGARQDELTFSEFTLVHDLKSQLFSSCFDELNTVEGTLHAIEVDEGKKYIRYLIDSDAEVTWEDVEGVDGTIACAFKAYEAELPMFKYSNGVCSLATKGIYDPEHASCDGEEVFIIDPLENVCSTPLGLETPGHQYYSWLCETNCGSSGILIDQNGDPVNMTYIPEKIAKCCPTRKTPCWQPINYFAKPCDADRFCYFLGMMLLSFGSQEMRDQLKLSVDSTGSAIQILVNVRYEGGSWYHFPGKLMVNSDEWEGGVAPTTEGFVALNKNLKLESVVEGDPVLAICQEREMLPECTEAK